MTGRLYTMAVSLETGAGCSLDCEVRFTLEGDFAEFAGVELCPLDSVLSDRQRQQLQRLAARWLATQQGQDYALEHVALRDQIGADFADKLTREAFIR